MSKMAEKTHDELEAERLQEMRKKSKKAGPTRIPCVLHNIEAPGEQIEACINGKTFIAQDGESVLLTRGQIEAIRNAKVETFIDVTDPDNPTGEGVITKPITLPRFSVEIQTEEIDSLVEKLAAMQKQADKLGKGAEDGGRISGRTD